MMQLRNTGLKQKSSNQLLSSIAVPASQSSKVRNQVWDLYASPRIAELNG
jgi:hypothetical protein